jgi:type IV fimbrial biogenesis protein FimT
LTGIRQSGITALDLLVTLAVVVLLVAAGTPSLRHYLSEQRMKAAVNLLYSDLVLARNEAISRNARIVVCPAGEEGSCSGSPRWHEGWLVFLDANDDRDWQTDETSLRRAARVRQLRINGSAYRTRLRFFPNGTAPGSNATLTFCDQRGARSARQIALSASGRIRQVAPGQADVTACGP